MTQPLFVKPEVSFEKTAGEVDLPEDASAWPHEVLQELYKQIPYMHDYDPRVFMQRVDSEQGFAQGYVEVQSRSQAAANSSEASMAAAGIRKVRIPVIVASRRLAPFDLLINDAGNVLPLTERRFSQAMFRPQMFDVTSQTPGDHSMIGQLYPPYRQNHGFGGGGVLMSAGMGKQGAASGLDPYTAWLVGELERQDGGFRSVKSASSVARPVVQFRKTASMMRALVPSFYEADVARFMSKLGSDRALLAAYRSNSRATSEPVRVLAEHQPVDPEKLASALSSVLVPTVVQLIRQSDRYALKTAAARCWNPTTVTLSRGEVVHTFGEKVALAVDEAGQVTMANAAMAGDPGEVMSESPKTVTTPGLYKVFDEALGNELVGFVIPNLLSLDGTPLPLALFTNGSHSALQPSIIGVAAGSGGNLPKGGISGSGAFYGYSDDGQLFATIPMTLRGSYVVGDEPAVWEGEAFDGEPVKVSVQPHVRKLLRAPDGTTIIPETWQWTPLGAAQAISLRSAEDDVEEVPEDWHESAPEAGIDGKPEEEKQSHVWVRGYGSPYGGAPTHFSFEGPGVALLEKEARQDLQLDEAMFLLGGLGVRGDIGISKLANSGQAPQKVEVARCIVTDDYRMKVAMTKVASYAAVTEGLRADLMKEAADIADPSTVDTVLSLGFINPENVMNFVSYLPTIEDAQMKLCDLLLAARVGLDLPRTALERAVRSVEETLEGLRTIAFQDS